MKLQSGSYLPSDKRQSPPSSTSPLLSRLEIIERQKASSGDRAVRGSEISGACMNGSLQDWEIQGRISGHPFLCTAPIYSSMYHHFLHAKETERRIQWCAELPGGQGEHGCGCTMGPLVWFSSAVTLPSESSLAVASLCRIQLSPSGRVLYFQTPRPGTRFGAGG